MINKILKRAQRSPHTHLPSLEGISLTKTKQTATSIRQTALLPMGRDIRNPLKDLFSVGWRAHYMHYKS